MAAIAPTPSSRGATHAARPRRRLLDGAKDPGAPAETPACGGPDDGCYRYAASLAYAALFSIFPLLLLCVTGLGVRPRERRRGAAQGHRLAERRDLAAGTPAPRRDAGEPADAPHRARNRRRGRRRDLDHRRQRRLLRAPGGAERDLARQDAPGSERVGQRGADGALEGALVCHGVDRGRDTVRVARRQRHAQRGPDGDDERRPRSGRGSGTISMAWPLLEAAVSTEPSPGCSSRRSTASSPRQT